jgi:uncharacterized membrane protein
MPRYEESVVIRRPLREVFDYMNDIAREREWQPRLRKAEQIPAGPVTVGTRRRYVSEFLGKRLENTYVITTYEPGRRVVAETTDDSVLQASSDIRWEHVEGGTRVTMTLEGKTSGPLRFVPAPLVEANFAKEVRNALRLLKERLEGEL